MLDEIDRKLMIALSKDGRRSYAKLANELGIKSITVAKRVDSMLKNDIFAISAIPDPFALGYKVMAVINLVVELSYVESVCDRLAENPYINYISTTFGRFDILLMVEHRDLESLCKLVKEEISNIQGVRTIETFIVSEVKKIYRGHANTRATLHKSIQINEIDEKLIRELRKNGRIAFTALAKRYGVSTAMVSRRVASLIKKNVIQITVLPNPARMGYLAVAYLCLQVKSGKLDAVTSRLSGYSQIPQIMTLLNGYDIVAVVALRNLEALTRFIMKEIATIDGILNVETLVRAEFKKRPYLGFDFEKELQQLA
jgi:DNA-binding Lrp family transcriptional regulator